MKYEGWLGYADQQKVYLFELQMQERNDLGTRQKAFDNEFVCFFDNTNKVVSLFEYDLVLYDEVENFRQYNEFQFSYPYTARKTRLHQYTFDFDTRTEDYSYPTGLIQWRISQICMGGSQFADLAFWDSTTKKAQEILFGIDYETDEEGGQEDFECDDETQTGYQKIVFERFGHESKKFLEDYEAGVVEDKILLELQVGMVGFKNVYERSSSSVLDLLGDIGGFNDFMNLMVAWIGEFFAAKFFMQSIAQNMFMKKLSAKEQEQKK